MKTIQMIIFSKVNLLLLNVPILLKSVFPKKNAFGIIHSGKDRSMMSAREEIVSILYQLHEQQLEKVVTLIRLLKDEKNRWSSKI